MFIKDRVFMKFTIIILFIASSLILFSKKKMEFEDIFQFESIKESKLSIDGNLVYYRTAPNRGNPKLIVRNLQTQDSILIERVIDFQYSLNNQYIACLLQPDFIDKLNDNDNKLSNSLKLLQTKNKESFEKNDISSYKLSNNGKWLGYTEINKEKKNGIKVNDFYLRHNESGTEILSKNVSEYIFDSLSNYVFYTIHEKNSYNSIRFRKLNEEFAPEFIISKDSNSKYSNILFSNNYQGIFFLTGELDKKSRTKDNLLLYFDIGKNAIDTLINLADLEDWYIPESNKLKLNQDETLLWVGIKPNSEYVNFEKDTSNYDLENVYDRNKILKESELFIWHNNDKEIIPHQINQWNRKVSQSYYSVYDLSNKKYLKLPSQDVKEIEFTNNENFAIAYDSEPYLKQITHKGWFYDVYLINIQSGEKKLIEKEISEKAHISPNGLFTLYFKNKNWYVHRNYDGTITNLTKNLSFNFFEEEEDRPQEPQSYGLAGWIDEGNTVILKDRYDLWSFNLETSDAINITNGYGRKNKKRINSINLDKYKKYFDSTEQITLYLYGEKTKENHIGLLNQKNKTIDIKTSGDFLYYINSVSDESDKVLISKQSFNTYPDLYYTERKFNSVNKITNFQEQVDQYLWGETELIDYVTSFGDTLQAFYALPENYQKGKKYPVLIYFYEKFSDRKNSFPTPNINHRPTYPIFLADEYVLLFPDIKFYDGRPGESSLEALMSASKKLIDLGIADQNKIVLHGHSWSGYESAWIITQTDFFKACVSGAPVSNMTSAYSGIRLGSGLARQFQYETGQSRIGGNLIDSLDSYIMNSPIFHANKMNTPLLIMFGDEDDAVPYQQGIELFLIMRRFNKNCIMLQYNKEPHHLKKVGNSLDYSIRMKEFFDFYIFGGEKPKWMEKGIEYRGRFNTGWED